LLGSHVLEKQTSRQADGNCKSGLVDISREVGFNLQKGKQAVVGRRANIVRSLA
jgi:hypothetical protein